MTMNIINLIPLTFFAVFCGWLAYLVGKTRGYDSRQPAVDELVRYRIAVEDLDRWCGHTSPHARLIARYLTAHGKGDQPINAGTPCDVEPCTIDGLRAQLKTLDVIESTLGEHVIAGERMRSAMRAYSAGQQMQTESRATVTAIAMNPDTYREAPSIHPISRA